LLRQRIKWLTTLTERKYMLKKNLFNEKLTLSNGSVLDPFVEELLKNRGIIGKNEVLKFLEPKLGDLPSPFLMKDMDVAVKLAVEAMEKGSHIIVWGDYDVDGTTATALLLKFFDSIGYKIDFHIPNRLTDGYGLEKGGLEKINSGLKDDNKLLITVDNGISAHEAVNRAKLLGYKVIITDHHTPPDERVPADAVLNPKQNACNFPDENLAGVGVAFYFAMGVRNYLSKISRNDSEKLPNLKFLLDLVGIGTVADMVPLTGVNRILVRAGMEVMALRTNKGLEALCRKTNIDCSFVRSEDISFQLAPKINAAGRLGKAEKAVHLFLSESKEIASEIASDLVSTNKQRQNINISQFAKAIDEIGKNTVNGEISIVVSGDYHVGVAGIVASNLVEKYKKPSIVLCEHKDGVLKGSARSIPGVNLYDALYACRKVLISFGGHKMAGGMSLNRERLNDFRELFDGAVYSQNMGESLVVAETVDADISVAALFEKRLLAQIHLMEPFGQANPQLIFRDTGSTIKGLSQIGRDKKHLRMSFVGERSKINGIGFGLGELEEKCKSARETECFYTPSVNFFRGKRSWQVRVTKILFP